MVLLFIPIAWIATAAGRQLADWLRLPNSASRLERNLIGFALGLGLLAYGMLALGLVKLLYPAAGLAWVLALAVLGARQHAGVMADLRVFAQSSARHRSIPLWWLLYLAFGAVSFVGVLAPPVQGLRGLFFSDRFTVFLTEWDSIAYHLADPKLYLNAHAIYYIPWEHHSNFGFTTEMWYTLGLMAGSEALAKVFHFACGAGTAVAIYLFCRRHLSASIGLTAAGLFVATPVIFWEAGMAYADLATAFYGILALLCLANGIQFNSRRWLFVGAVLMGLMLSTKATAVATVALGVVAVFVAALCRRPAASRGGALGLAVGWAAVAVLVGSPWLIKSMVYTGNPIYPFYYQIFGGKYWNAQNAALYDASNASFGMGHGARLAFFAPWNLTMNPLSGHPLEDAKQAFNNFPTSLTSLGPIFLACLFVPAFLRGRAPGVVMALTGYVAISLLLWFGTMQYVRYMVHIVPVLCMLTAWLVHKAVETKALVGYALRGLTAASIAFSLLIGFELFVVQSPVAFGAVSREEYIQRGFSAYPAMAYINKNLPANARIVTYNLPLGYYCDRQYLWGDPGHSTYIPYDQFKSAQDLKDYLHKLGVTHVLIESQFPFKPGDDYVGWLYALTAGSGQRPVYADRAVVLFALPQQ
jgi:hypothetical protein